MVTLTKELLESWDFINFIPEKLLPIEVDQLFEAPISTEDKVQVLLHEEILGRRGLVYVAARAARRACTETGWSHPDSLRALDLCDRYASGKEIPEKELRVASKAADAASETTRTACGSSSVARAAWSASWASKAAFSASFRSASWAVSDASDASEIEQEAQLNDCREWILRESRKERAPVPTRYQRILRATW